MIMFRFVLSFVIILLLSISQAYAECDAEGSPTSCSNCGFWPWSDKCDWTEIFSTSGVVYKQLDSTDCTPVCSGEYTTNHCPWGFVYEEGEQKYTWNTSAEINISSYLTFKAQYNPEVNETTTTIDCSTEEDLPAGNHCGHEHWHSLKWNYTQKIYKQRVYDWHEDFDYIDWQGGWICKIVYDNPHICDPCVSSIATGEEVGTCDYQFRTVLTIPPKVTSGCGL